MASDCRSSSTLKSLSFLARLISTFKPPLYELYALSHIENTLLRHALLGHALLQIRPVTNNTLNDFSNDIHSDQLSNERVTNKCHKGECAIRSRVRRAS